MSEPKLLGAVLGPAFKRPVFRPDVVVELGGIGLAKFELAVQLDADETDWEDFRGLDANGNLVVITGPLGTLIEEHLNELKLDAFGIRAALERRDTTVREARAEERVESRRSA
jgi:hypothetical protein